MLARKTIYIITGLVVTCSLFGQQKSERIDNLKKHFFYVSAIELFSNTFQVGYEQSLKNHNTIALIGGFTLSKENEEINRLGGSGEIQYRINLLYDKETIDPFTKKMSTFAYFAPYVQYKYEEISDELYENDIYAGTEITYVNSTFSGVGFGLRFTAIDNRFCINTFAGGGIKYSDVKNNKKYTQFLEVGYTGIAPKLSLQVGIAF